MATQLGQSHTIVADGTTVTVSPLSYVYSMLDASDASDAGKNLVCALYELYQACEKSQP